MDSTNYTRQGQEKSQVSEAAGQLLDDGKKLAHEIYEANAKKVSEAQDHLKEYTDELCTKVKANPVSALLIAGGVGFLLAALLRK